jgi:hypothetical protein
MEMQQSDQELYSNNKRFTMVLFFFFFEIKIHNDYFPIEDNYELTSQ